MLDIKFIKENKEIVKEAIKNKQITVPIDLDELFRLYDEKRSLQQKIDALNQKKNEAARTRAIDEGKKIKEELAGLEVSIQVTEKKILALMLLLPNVPSPDTP